jgi:hypothetical protein
MFEILFREISANYRTNYEDCLKRIYKASIVYKGNHIMTDIAGAAVFLNYFKLTAALFFTKIFIQTRCVPPPTSPKKFKTNLASLSISMLTILFALKAIAALLEWTLKKFVREKYRRFLEEGDC